jgi:diguanylate cyclase (GGDEF)-like protein
VLFSDRLQTAIALAKRSGLVAVHCVNIDRFRHVNERLGHQAGDALLVAVADRLGKAVREHDTVARLGGDEFAIVQTGIRQQSDAAALARRVLNLVARPFEIFGDAVGITVSIGIALSPTNGRTTDEVMRKADTALYRSRTRNRGCFGFHDD